MEDPPLTGDSSVLDEEQPPKIRANPRETLEFSGWIGFTGGRVTDEQLIALLPEGFWPRAPRTVDVASDAARSSLQLGIEPKGLVRLRTQDGSTRATWISLDGASCRIDGDEA
ncbi:hypothetical protein ACFVDU_12760 [Streptomyces albidoflavus]